MEISGGEGDRLNTGEIQLADNLQTGELGIGQRELSRRIEGVDNQSICAAIGHGADHLEWPSAHYQLLTRDLNGRLLVPCEIVLGRTRAGSIVLNACDRRLITGLYLQALGIVVNERRRV